MAFLGGLCRRGKSGGLGYMVVWVDFEGVAPNLRSANFKCELVGVGECGVLSRAFVPCFEPDPAESDRMCADSPSSPLSHLRPSGQPPPEHST